MTRAEGIAPVSTPSHVKLTPALQEGVPFTPAASIDRLSTAGKTSVPATATSRPKLDPPLVEYGIIASIEGAQTRAKSSLTRQCKRLDDTYDEIDKITKQNMDKLQQAAEASQKRGVWSLLKQIGTCILGAITVALGFALSATGAGSVIGGAMIASGLLMITNLIITEAGGWDWVAKKASNGNEELEKKLQWILPAVFGVIAAGAGVFGSAHALATLWPTLNLTQQMLTIATSAANFALGVATIGEGINNAKNLRLEGDITGFQKDLFSNREKAKKALSGMGQIMESQNKVCKQAGRIINLSINSTEQIVAQG